MNTAKELRLPHSESPPQVSKTHVVPNGFVKKHTLPSVDHQVVRFRSLGKPNEDDFLLVMSKKHSYDDVVEGLAVQLNLNDPSKIRLTSHNCHSQQPKKEAIKYRGVANLFDMLFHGKHTSDILYYEVLDIPLPELQDLRNLKVYFHHATKDQVVVHNLRLPKQRTVEDVLNELKMKVELSNPNAELRLIDVLCHWMRQIFPPDEKVENLALKRWHLRAEEISEEEKNLGPHDLLIQACHFTKEYGRKKERVKDFGVPFLLAIHEGETLAEIKLRIQKKLQIPDEDFAKWKFACMALHSSLEYLRDSDVVLTRFKRRGVFYSWECLGLEHSRSEDASQVVNATSISAKRPSNEPDNEALKKKPKPKSAHCLGREVKNLERTQDNEMKDSTLEPPTAEFDLTDDSEQQMTNISSEVQATDVSECQVSCKSPEISFETQDNETKDPTLEPPMAEFHLTGDSEQQMTNISSEVQATDVSECQVSCKSPEISFDEMAISLLAKLEEDKASNSVRMGDFNNVTSNRYVDVGVFTVPESIHSYAKDLLANRPDIGTGNSPIHYVNEMAFVVLCCALKSMDTTRSSEITESLILKWRDAIRGALQFGFKVGFLKDHLRSATQAHLAKSARNSHESKELQAIKDKITTMEKHLHMLKAHHAEMYGKMHSDLRKTCEMAATKFSGETYGSFFD